MVFLCGEQLHTLQPWKDAETFPLQLLTSGSDAVHQRIHAALIESAGNIVADDAAIVPIQDVHDTLLCLIQQKEMGNENERFAGIVKVPSGNGKVWKRGGNGRQPSSGFLEQFLRHMAELAVSVVCQHIYILLTCIFYIVCEILISDFGFEQKRMPMQGFGGGVWLDTGEGISFTIKIAFVRFAYHTANFSGLERLGDFLNAIVAVDKNWGIGYKGQLLAHIPEDMKRFRDITMGHPILYGRKTLETFPYKKPLPGRMNYILSRNRSLMVPGATVLHSISEALQSCPDNTFVIGGSEIYDLLLPYCSIAHVTKIAAVFSADAWFQNLDESAIWKLADKGALREHNGLYYQFSIYQNNHNQEDK